MQFRLALGVFVAAMALSVPASAASINVTAGATVTATGDIGVITCCFGDASLYPPAALASLVDGVYRPEGTYWQDGTVWWDERHPGSANNIIEFDLHGLYLIDFLSIQADNNDNYGIFVRDRFGVWFGLATAVPFGGAGMRERAGGFEPFEATAFRIDAFGGDEFYALSEFRAMGSAVPEPASLVLLATGLVFVSYRLRRRVG